MARANREVPLTDPTSDPLDVALAAGAPRVRSADDTREGKRGKRKGSKGRDDAAPPPLPLAVSVQELPPDAGIDHPALYFNRELSWIDFNWRVLYQAMDERLPLLERLRFLAITQSNLDEFWRKRVGGLKRQLGAGVSQLSCDGRTPAEQLELISHASAVMQRAMGETWHDLRRRLRDEAQIRIRAYDGLSADERERLHAIFRASIYPILTPLAVDPGHPFPFISNLSLSLAVSLSHPRDGTRHFARVKIPMIRGRWVPVGERHHFIAIEELVRAHMDELFAGMVVDGAWLFRVTRNADLRRNEEEADDLLQMISDELRERRIAPVVRLEVEASMPQHMRGLLARELELDASEVQAIDGLMDLSDLVDIADLDCPAHHYSPWEPVLPMRLAHSNEYEDTPDIFSVLRAGDVFVHHPYESFTLSVQRFVEEAASDPGVLAIKQTLYRTSEDSPLVNALMRAAEQGKQVAVLVEVTARFDEEANIEWGQRLEKAGVHVTYGVVGLKTHAKITLVVREENDQIRTYCHIGTGNYHPKNALLYTDMGLLTADEVIGADVTNLFHYLTGYAPEQRYRNLLVAPRDLRPALISLIENEIEHHSAGRGGRIILKMNAIDDIETITALYRAAQAGVEIDLIVRGHTRLRPGVPGFSERIRVISILGRFLEHDRIFWFGNGGEPRVYIGSADWRRRNLEDRVEAVVRLTDPALQERVRQTLEAALADNRTAWDLRADGRYVLRQPAHGEPDRSFQEHLMREAVARRLGNVLVTNA